MCVCCPPNSLIFYVGFRRLEDSVEEDDKMDIYFPPMGCLQSCLTKYFNADAEEDFSPTLYLKGEMDMICVRHVTTAIIPPFTGVWILGQQACPSTRGGYSKSTMLTLPHVCNPTTQLVSIREIPGDVIIDQSMKVHQLAMASDTRGFIFSSFSPHMYLKLLGWNPISKVVAIRENQLFGLNITRTLPA
jgi:hypothetical protein